jgi:hypothetical protein
MSKEKFEKTWAKFSYNRLAEEGDTVVFPEPTITDKRTAYGRNGKERHALFCFSNHYDIETWQNGRLHRYHVKRSSGAAALDIEHKDEEEKDGYGTKISCHLHNNYLSESDVRVLLGSRFITDPSFEIYLNGKKIELLEVTPSDVKTINIDGNQVKIYEYDCQLPERTSKQNGVAWWVNKRLVGEHSWDGITSAFIDRRVKQAKRFTYIVEADYLKEDVLEDWTGFRETPNARKAKLVVNTYITDLIHELLKESRTEIKKSAVMKVRESIRDLTPASQEKVGQFIDELQKSCPSMGEETLTATLEVFVKMEKSKTGFKLIKQLSDLSPDDIDSMTQILETWSVTDAKIVLDELYRRLSLISELERLSKRDTTDELHELQPLIAEGLWIFGPEYEGPQFTSNRQLLTIVVKLLGYDGERLETPTRRADFVVLPNSSLSIHSRDSYDDNGEVNGIDKILVIEIKKGGFEIGMDEYRQAEDYAVEIRKSGEGSGKTTKIHCFVIGKSVDPYCSGGVKDGGLTYIVPISYMIVLNGAKARTFNLLNKIKTLKNIEYIGDREITDVLKQKDLIMYDKEEAQ